MEYRSLTPDSLEMVESPDPQAGSQQFVDRHSGLVSPLEASTYTSLHTSRSVPPYNHDTPMLSSSPSSAAGRVRQTATSYEATSLLSHDAHPQQAASPPDIAHNASADSTSLQGKHGAPKPPREDATKKPRCRPKPVPSWWWWEITAAALSIVCMSLILVLLMKISNISLSDWPLPIQPNSLIAVLTTVGKASLLVPVAACISQLKWRHFQQRQDHLQTMQLFDDASRGPWGSAVMLLSVRTRAVLAWAFAFVTVAALGIDPTAQQILEFPSRTVELKNVTARIGVATDYSSKGYLEGDICKSASCCTNLLIGVRTKHTAATTVVPNPDLLKLQSSMVNGASGQVPAPNFVCPSPATTCNWDRFTTLGLCSSFQNLTDVATANCTGNTFYRLDCTYDFPGRREDSEPPVTMYYNQVGTTNSPPTSLFSSIASDLHDGDDVSGSYVGLTAVRVTNNDMDDMDGTTPPQTELLRSTWFWCSHTFHNVTAAQGLLSYEAMESQKLNFLSVVTSSDGRDNQVYNAPNSTDTGAQYNITTNSELHLFHYFTTLLTRGVNQSALPQWNYGDPQTEDLDLGYFLYTSDLANVTADLATTVTNQIRSSSPGDNAKATMFAGRAYLTETYIRVRWAWLILPFATTALGAVLLALAILVSWKQPVLHSSVFPYVAYHFDDTVGDELRELKPESAENMSLAARGLCVKLVRDSEGRMAFVRMN
ncbi:hypothetical protein CONLIGDRAFT_482321 [Coniochaeta ligniaria NRRL 30616]|uniref:Uncharacterized protein n=1 Tax=Coniochaeta ligniaria NRRL 30616 TaxID=1408157 RepID=A0A1J7JGA7_9PEZI|nr:hypothetical protein CONLIGDRAFT_482321 [Coniochaeta ligniaria NRRL 30616]